MYLERSEKGRKRDATELVGRKVLDEEERGRNYTEK